MKNENYKPRLIDKVIEKYLKFFGAILIEGPKWCGKTWSSLNGCNSKFMLGERDVFTLVKTDESIIFDLNKNKTPILIDEWQRLPHLWDSVRNECDKLTTYGNFILTGSTKLFNKDEIFHSGTGRIARIKMYTMSLYESGDTSNEISIIDMLNNKYVFNELDKVFTLEEVAKLIIRGGWPVAVNFNSDSLITIWSEEYIKSLVYSDIKEFGNKNTKKMLMILRSLARNESTVVSDNTILKDTELFIEAKEDRINSLTTLSAYLDVLRKLNVLIEDEAFTVNYRSSNKVGKSVKRHLVDPSLSCSLLGLNQNNLIQDIRTFGFMFEALVIRDLRIYAQYLGGNIKHFRDNSSGMEIDAIMEFEDGYAAFEIKLGWGFLDEAKENLIKFYKNVEVKPKFMCIIFGISKYITYDKENNIYIVPFNCLKPE